MANQAGSISKPQVQWKKERFFAVMNKFGIVHLFSFLVFTGLFAILSNWNMVLISATGAALWLAIYLAYQKHHSRQLFIIGAVVSTIYSILATLEFGWASGFFFLVLTVLPLTFLNIRSGKFIAVLLGLLLGGGILGMHIFTWYYTPTDSLAPEVIKSIYLINLLWCVVTLAVMGYFFEKAATETESTLVLANKRLSNLASTDPVTNLANRRTMLGRIDLEKARLERNGEAFTLIMIDIDNFKDINDQYGHDGGDYVLVKLAAIINFIVRKQDQVARWGGDEFLVFLPETGLEGGRIVAEKIRGRILTTPFIYREADIPVTVTLGVSECDSDIGIGNSIRKADLALYAGKQAGKNRVTLG